MSRYPGYPDPEATRPSRVLDYSSDRAVVGQFMNAVYAWMCVGLATTAVVAWYVASQPSLIKTIFTSGLFWPLVIGELALVWVIGAAVNRISAGVATALFVLYAALNGLTLSILFLAYSLTSIAGAFLVTAGMFGAASIYGYVTRKDLTSLGSFLFMALIGLVLASVVNIFWANSTLYWIVTYAGVFIFVGLTAYDTQKLRDLSYQVAGNEAVSSRLAIIGSLALYLDFINLFIFMLRILGDRRR